jgi:hypothetical protein
VIGQPTRDADYRHTDDVRGALGDPEFTVDDATVVVVEHFLLERLS